MNGMPLNSPILGFINDKYYFYDNNGIYKCDSNFENVEIDTSFSERYVEANIIRTQEISEGFLLIVEKFHPSETIGFLPLTTSK
ncbi:MAG: hypothetical protein ACI85O_002360 [Saprospiraceae bacterium]|jgi:hypothetical protein